MVVYQFVEEINAIMQFRAFSTELSKTLHQLNTVADQRTQVRLPPRR